MDPEIAALQEQVKQLQDDMRHLKWYLGLPSQEPLKNNMRTSLHCRAVSLVNDQGEVVGSWQANPGGPVFWMRASEPGDTLVELGVNKDGGYAGINAPDGTARAQMYIREDRGEVAVFTTGGQPRAGMKAFAKGGTVVVVDDSLHPRALMTAGDHGGELLAFSKQDKRMAAVYAGEGGGTVAAFNQAGQAVGMLASMEEEGSILLQHADGSMRVGLSARADGGRLDLFAMDCKRGASVAIGEHGGYMHIQNTTGESVAQITAAAEGGQVIVNNNAGKIVGMLHANEKTGGMLHVTDSQTKVASINGIICTAVGCEAGFQVISNADSASNQSNLDAGTAQAALQTGLGAARNRLIGLRSELDQLMANDDPRWLAFGFDMPGHPSTPDVPMNLVVTLGAVGSRQQFYDWDNARRADTFRLVIKDAAGGELVNVIVSESEYMATDLPAGTTVSTTVTGRNGPLESLPSAVVTAVVP